MTISFVTATDSVITILIAAIVCACVRVEMCLVRFPLWCGNDDDDDDGAVDDADVVVDDDGDDDNDDDDDGDDDAAVAGADDDLCSDEVDAATGCCRCS